MFLRLNAGNHFLLLPVAPAPLGLSVCSAVSFSFAGGLGVPGVPDSWLITGSSAISKSTETFLPCRDFRIIGGGVALSRSSSAAPVRLIQGGSTGAPVELENAPLGGSVGPCSVLGVGVGAPLGGPVEDLLKNLVNLFCVDC